jgi:hypothetical protein
MPHCGTVQKSKEYRRKRRNRYHSIQINDSSLSWRGTNTSMKSSGVWLQFLLKSAFDIARGNEIAIFSIFFKIM